MQASIEHLGSDLFCRSPQAVLRAFRDAAPGVLIHGMGSLGKSSLAARIGAA